MATYHLHLRSLRSEKSVRAAVEYASGGHPQARSIRFSGCGSNQRFALSAPMPSSVTDAIVSERGGMQPSRRETWAYEVSISIPDVWLGVPETTRVRIFRNIVSAWMRKHCRGMQLMATVHLERGRHVMRAVHSTLDPETKKPFFGMWAKRETLFALHASFSKEGLMEYNLRVLLCAWLATMAGGRRGRPSLVHRGQPSHNHFTVVRSPGKKKGQA